jgi:hypothetical protein
MKSRKKRNKRRRRRNWHHLSPRSLGRYAPFQGEGLANKLLIDVEKHALIHKIFGNRTWEEIIAVMQRVARMKGRSNGHLRDMPDGSQS